jgi:hypothetical protein
MSGMADPVMTVDMSVTVKAVITVPAAITISAATVQVTAGCAMKLFASAAGAVASVVKS